MLLWDHSRANALRIWSFRYMAYLYLFAHAHTALRLVRDFVKNWRGLWLFLKSTLACYGYQRWLAVLINALSWLLHYFYAIGAWHSGGVKVRYTLWVIGLLLLMPRYKSLLYAGALWTIRELAVRCLKFASWYGLYVVSRKDIYSIFSTTALLRSYLNSAFARGWPEGAMRALLCTGFISVNILLLLFQCICHLVQICVGAGHHGFSTGMPCHVFPLWYYVIPTHIGEAVARRVITLEVSSWGNWLLCDSRVFARARLELLAHDEHVLLEGSLLFKHIWIENYTSVWDIDRSRLPITPTFDSHVLIIVVILAFMVVNSVFRAVHLA